MENRVQIPLELFIEIINQSSYLTLKRLCGQDRAIYQLCRQEPALSIIKRKRKEYVIQLARRHIVNGKVNWYNVIDYGDPDVVDGLLALGYLQGSGSGATYSLKSKNTKVNFVTRIIQALIKAKDVNQLSQILKVTSKDNAWPVFTHMILDSGLNVQGRTPHDDFDDELYEMFAAAQQNPGLRW